MKIYIVALPNGKKSIELSIMSRKRKFKNGEEVQECNYTNTYSQYFKTKSKIIGLSKNLSKPTEIMINPKPKENIKTKQNNIQPHTTPIEAEEIIKKQNKTTNNSNNSNNQKYSVELASRVKKQKYSVELASRVKSKKK